MNGPDQFDQRLRAALEWEADQTASRQPSFDRAIAQLAERIGDGTSTETRPMVFGSAASRRAVALLVAALLLGALLAALFIAGSPQSRLTDLNPGRFGLPVDCGATLPEGVLYDLALPDERRRQRLHDDGRLITARMPAGSAPDLAHPGSDWTFQQQRLSESGVAAARDSIATMELTPGCRVAFGPPVTFITRLEGGVARFQTTEWFGAYKGYELIRTMSSWENEIAFRALNELTVWRQENLPPEGWVDRTLRTVDASVWLPEPETLLPSDATLPRGALSGLDPCRLLAPGAIGADIPRIRASPLRFSYLSPACEYLADGIRVAMLSVRGQTTTLQDAQVILDGLFGGEAVGSAPQGDGRRWFNGCWLDRLACPFAVAGWTDGHLVVVVLEPDSIGRPSTFELDYGGDILEAVFANLAG